MCAQSAIARKPYDPEMIGAIVRLVRLGWSMWLVYLGLIALLLLGLLLSDGAWWALPLFAFFAFGAWAQIRNRRRYDRS
jgi:hypothetical protein